MPAKPGPAQFTFNPAIFEVSSPADAMRVILTPEGSSTTEQRWAKETPYLADLIARSVKLHPGAILLDYGCGVGRIARALIERQACRVVGVDSSSSMRALAASYVRSDLFFSCAPAMLDELGARGLVFDAAISVWVLQHCAQPDLDIARIKRALKPGAILFVVNNWARAVPALERTWVNDGIDVRALLGREFQLKEEGKLAPEAVNDVVSGFSFWASFERQA